MTDSNPTRPETEGAAILTDLWDRDPVAYLDLLALLHDTRLDGAEGTP